METIDRRAEQVSAITGVPVDQLVGPFVKEPPERYGVYARISAKTGEVVFANYTQSGWLRYSSTMAGALLKNRPTRYLGLPWFGVSEAVAKPNPMAGVSL